MLELTSRGWIYFSLLGFSSVVSFLYVGWGLAAFCAAVAFLVAIIYRDPEREIPALPLGVLSPVDGQVLSVETVTDPFLNRKAKRISIKMKSLGPFVARCPIEGKLLKVWVKERVDSREENALKNLGSGELTDPDNLPRATLRTNFACWIQTDEHDDVVFSVQKTMFDFSTVWMMSVGERIGQGQRCSYISFGQVVHVFIPFKSKLKIEPNVLLFSGSSHIATLIH